VGSLRDLLESLRFDMDSGAKGSDAEKMDGINEDGEERGVFGEDSEQNMNAEGHRHPPHVKNVNHDYGFAGGEDDDDGENGMGTNPNMNNEEDSFSGGSDVSDDSEEDSVKSYEDAGYDNEEDYLFDQYGGIGGTAEERAELAEALMHTLNVGPMADDLFYEEVAMCFLRCRERHRMRTWREELRERKRQKRREAKRLKRRKMKRQQQQGGHHRHASSGGKEMGVSGSEGVSARIAKMNMRDEGGPVDSEYEPHDDDSVDHISEGMRNVNVESDFEDLKKSRRRRGMSRGEEHDRDTADDASVPSDTSPLYSSDRGDDDDDSFMQGPNKKGMSSNTSDEDEADGARRSSMYNFVDENEADELLDDDSIESEFSAEDVDEYKRRSEADMENDYEDDTAYGVNGYNEETPRNEDPVFRVDLTSGQNKKAQTKKGGRYPPPPPPPPPPPRGGHAEHHYEHGSPMDVDDEFVGLSYEEKIALGARKAAEESALKNDHESLRKDFAVGQSDDEKKGQKSKHRPGQRPSMLHKRDKTFFGFDDTVAEESNLTPDDGQGNAKRQQVAMLRDEGRSYYINGAYRDSVLRYTEAASVHTDNFQVLHNTANDETLAALYGNRAAALMMTGAYLGAAADCNRALQCTSVDSNAGSFESGPAFRSKILCRMARALLKAGNVWEADKAFNSAVEAAKEALALVNRAGSGPDETRAAEKILSQSMTDATLGLSDVKRYREALDGATKISADNKGGNFAADKRNSVQLLMFINSALSVSPGSMELHERKVNALAALKRWAELGNHCERLAAEMVKIDGVFKGDLAPLNPFPDIKHATSLKPDFFERNPDDVSDPASLRILSPKAVCDAVMRLPNGILPLYLRSLRLEERYTEAAKAGANIETHMSNSKHKGSRGNVPMPWLANERDKLRRTMSWKEKGDTLFRNGDYERAASKYAACLGIDGDTSEYSQNPLENEDAGGRLHAVLHCNRAACLMALKKYREAVKECTASLRIHTHYMKAMLRRGRCFARIRQYQEAVAEYERYIGLVDDAKRSPQNSINSNAACTFDRPADITQSEYSKAKQELADVKKSMEQAASNAQAQQTKQTEQQQWYNDNFRKAAATNAAQRRKEAPAGPNKNTAYARKQQWDASGANTRRAWDQFGGTSPKKHGQKKSSKDAPSGGGTSGPSANRGSQNKQQQAPPAASKDVVHCHYAVLEIQMTASSAEIKKAYHKMALKYHPDKNSEEGAADIFRRVKLAYEVLGNDQTRISYDAERRRRR